ncbi:MAG: hypothetical protein OXH06_11105 [Gemmatimonadetes bacterium]|nr:hypothetical protein [Gemmatimonadota bacterium]MDE3256645.1 hypothetical protein [Gemmatimonadota bacterium]
MKRREIGKFQSFVLEEEDTVVVMGNLKAHADFLAGLGFSRHPDTGEYVGTGANLYAMAPDDFYDRFSARTGADPELTAQAHDGEDFYQIDGLPLAAVDVNGNPYIEGITAVDIETRVYIEQGVANFRVG